MVSSLSLVTSLIFINNRKEANVMSPTVIFFQNLKLQMCLHRIFLIFPVVYQCNKLIPSKIFTAYSFTILFIYIVFALNVILEVSLTNPRLLEFMLSTGYLGFVIQSFQFVISKLSTITIVILAIRKNILIINFYYYVLHIDTIFQKVFGHTLFQDNIQFRIGLALFCSIVYTSFTTIFITKKLIQFIFVNWFNLLTVQSGINFDFVFNILLTIGYCNCVTMLRCRFAVLHNIIEKKVTYPHKYKLIQIMQLHEELFKGIELLNQSHQSCLAIRMFSESIDITLCSYMFFWMIIKDKYSTLPNILFYASHAIIKVCIIIWYSQTAMYKASFL